ncbi:MAG: PKD domain-containing protein, partial [Bacteroidetes bacterium]|nr:PKD domain-containing protein [Bacteroidota bacterium]
MKCRYLPCRISLIVLLCACMGTARAQLSAAFSATPLSGCAPLLVSFTDSSAGNPDQWEWDLGNGTVSFFQHPSVTYFNPGTYAVRLTVKKGGASATVTKTQYITVYAPPKADFAPSATGGCFPLTVNFTDKSLPGSGNIASYIWDFGDGTTGNTANPSHVYNGAGTFTVSLQVVNSNGCRANYTSPSPITIFGGVNAGFTVGHANSCQAPANVPFTNTSTGTGTLTYSWDFGDGATSTALNPAHNYTANGSYTVRLTTTNNSGCANTFTQTVNVGTAKADFSMPSIFCVNEAINLGNLSAPAPQSISWDFGNGTGSTDPNPVISYPFAGTYTVSLSADFGICQDIKVKTIQIIPRPVADFSAPVTASCKAPFTASFTSLSPGAVAWDWDFGDGTTGTGATPSHTYTSEGSFPVRLTITNSAGCKETVEKIPYITIRKPDVQIISFDQLDCIPFSFSPVLYVNSVVPSTGFTWDFGDGSTGTGQSPNHVYTQKGTYTVTLTWQTADGCRETITRTNMVKVGKKVNVDFTASPLLVCASDPITFTDITGQSTTEPIDAWFWNFGDGGTSDQNPAPHLFQDTGRFSVTLTVWSNGCFSTKTKYDYVRVMPPIARFTVGIDCSRPYYRSFGNSSIVNRSASPLTWEWDFGDGTTSTSEFASHTYAAQGKYIVTLTVVNGGCRHSVSQEVIITET